jgi:hypothetical protein
VSSYTAPPLGAFEFDGERLTFESAVRTRWACNNTVTARYVPAKDSKRAVVDGSIDLSGAPVSLASPEATSRRPFTRTLHSYASASPRRRYVVIRYPSCQLKGNLPLV